MGMTSRERVERVIRFEKPDRVPFNFWMDRRRMAELENELGANFRVSHYGADVIETFPWAPWPTGRHEEGMGTTWLAQPLFETYDQTASIVMPDPNDEAIYEAMKRDIAQYPDKALLAGMPNVLSLMELMKSQQTLYMDMMLYPEEVQKFFHRISDIQAAICDRVCRLDVTAIYVMDDIGFNSGLLVSPELFRQFIFPHWKKVIDVARGHGKPVFFHTDGKVDSIWDVFADELGVRMLNPIQPNLQDVGEFKRRYHGRMGCYGGIDTAQIHTLTPEQIRAHVADLFAKVGDGGGLIISTHDLDQRITREQLDALVLAIKDCVY